MKMILCFVLLVISIYYWIYKPLSAILKYWFIRKNGIKTKGIITGYKRKPEEEEELPLYYPIIEYFNLAGEKKVCISEVGSSERLRLHKPVAIWYPEYEPSKKIAGKKGLIDPIIMLFSGVLVVAFLVYSFTSLLP